MFILPKCSYYISTPVLTYTSSPSSTTHKAYNNETMWRHQASFLFIFLFLYTHIQRSTYKYLLEISWIFGWAVSTVLLSVRCVLLECEVGSLTKITRNGSRRGWLYFYRDVLGIGIVNTVSHSKQIVKRSYSVCR